MQAEARLISPQFSVVNRLCGSRPTSGRGGEVRAQPVDAGSHSSKPTSYATQHHIPPAPRGVRVRPRRLVGPGRRSHDSPGGHHGEVLLQHRGGTTVADLTGNAKFPNSPDAVTYPTYFELNATGDINTAAPNTVDNYGAQMLGYFYPPATGDYIFYLASDDGGQLWLSTDADPANKKLIAQEAGWSNARSYTAIGGGSTVEAKDSSQFTGTQWPTKDPVYGGAKITLTANRAYYIEALMKEGGGGDNLSVAVQDPNFVIDSTKPIPGQYLSSFDKASGPVVITTQPQSQTVNQGDPVTFTVAVDGTPPYNFQWMVNNSEVQSGAQASYNITRALATQNNAKVKVVVTGGQGSPVTSAEATLTVISDVTPPTLVGARGSASFNAVTVTFSEPLDPATANTAANYRLSGGLNVTAASLSAAPNDNTVVLTTSRQSEGTVLTLTVNNVKDLAGLTIAANSTIDFKTHVFATGWASYQRWHNENGDPGDINAFATAIADGTIRAPDYESAVTQFGGPWGRETITRRGCSAISSRLPMATTCSSWDRTTNRWST
ncbi:MAG: PA14 domain-containing protein [Verrucomicrobia bacterium]|nr:PA14 domain-containing protein [Verrucomicrobiota bacterium]